VLISRQGCDGVSGGAFNGLDVSVFAQNVTNYHTPTFVARDVASAALNGYAVNYDTNYFAHGFAPLTIGVTASLIDHSARAAPANGCRLDPAHDTA
jgi:hypothetical protein